LFYALVNDSRRAVAPDVLNAFAAYQVEALPWSRRNQIAEALMG